MKTAVKVEGNHNPTTSGFTVMYMHTHQATSISDQQFPRFHRHTNWHD